MQSGFAQNGKGPVMSNFIFADIWTFRNGKATQMRSFGERQQALEWAGANHGPSQEAVFTVG